MSEDPTREPEPVELQAIAGIVAAGVARELARPIRRLREALAVMVEQLDSHVNTARGPTPLPWKGVQALRQEVADAYLLSRTVARLAGDLADGIDTRERAARAVDVNRQVEAALNLARHRFGAATELFIDLGSVPPILAVPGELMLAICELLMVCAESATAREGSAVSIRTRHERNASDDGGLVVVFVADNGGGAPVAAERAQSLLAPLAARVGGTCEGTSEPGTGTVFELRLPTRAEPAGAP